MRSELLPHLLVVDDEAAVREALTAALAENYVVHSAATGAAACAVLARHPIAAIILDAVLGEEEGLALVPRFRALSPAPILILTGRSTEDLAIRAVQVHVADYLKKPVDIGTLRRAVDRLVEPDCASPVFRLRRHLDEHPGAPFSPDEIASQLGVSEPHLRRLFRQAYGVTPRQYLTVARLRRAAELLQTTPLGVEQIAVRVGYQSATLFDRLFRRIYHQTPTEFRARRDPSASPGR